MQRIFVLILASLFSAWAPANTITLNATRTGWYSQDGNMNAAENYFTGWIESGPNIVHHSYFVFRKPTLSPAETIVGARLLLENPAFSFSSPDPTETVQFVDVLTPVSQRGHRRKSVRDWRSHADDIEVGGL